MKYITKKTKKKAKWKQLEEYLEDDLADNQPILELLKGCEWYSELDLS